MSPLFNDAYSIDYPIIDSDAHVNEPPKRWQARARKVLHTEEGDIWSLAGIMAPSFTSRRRKFRKGIRGDYFAL